MSEPFPVVAPQEAIDFFRAKGLAIGFAWQDVWQEEHARAFTVAKAMSRELLELIREAVDKALAEGSTLDTFRRELRPLLEAKGWWGRRSMVDPLSGEQKVVQLGSPRRLKTIFEVNMRSAYAAGRWERAQRSKKAFPFLRYVTAGDAKVRPEHQAWHGVVRPIDDDFWDTHFPPCGWNCRCTAVPLSRSTMARRGWEVTDKPPAFPPVPYTNPRTGEVTAIEKGIDPGFAFNVGKSYLGGLEPRPIGEGGEGSDIAAARPTNPTAAFFDALGLDADEAARGRVIEDAAGWPLAISAALFRGVDGREHIPGPMPADPRLLADRLRAAGLAIAEPDEIRLRWVRGRDGRAILVRRYFRGAVAVEIGAAGWRFLTPDAIGVSIERLRAGLKIFDGEEAATAAYNPHQSRDRLGRFSRSRAIGFVQAAADGHQTGVRSMIIGQISEKQKGRLKELGIEKKPLSVAIDATRARHAMKGHGKKGRTRDALLPEDLAKSHRIFNAAELSKGTPFFVQGHYRVHAKSKVDGVRYGGVFEVRRNHVVPLTLYRRK